MVSSKVVSNRMSISPSWSSYYVIILVLIHVTCVVSDRHLRSSSNLIVQNVTSGLNVLSGYPADWHCGWFFSAIGVDEGGTKKDDLIVAILPAGDSIRDSKSDDLEAGYYERCPGEQLTWTANGASRHTRICQD
jgi:hypothetical protein